MLNNVDFFINCQDKIEKLFKQYDVKSAIVEYSRQDKAYIYVEASKQGISSLERDLEHLALHEGYIWIFSVFSNSVNQLPKYNTANEAYVKNTRNLIINGKFKDVLQMAEGDNIPILQLGDDKESILHTILKSDKLDCLYLAEKTIDSVVKYYLSTDGILGFDKKMIAFLNHKDTEGNNPLHLAMQQFSKLYNSANTARNSALQLYTISEIIKYMMECGADINAKNQTGQSPLDLCFANLGMLEQNKDTSKSAVKYLFQTLQLPGIKITSEQEKILDTIGLKDSWEKEKNKEKELTLREEVALLAGITGAARPSPSYSIAGDDNLNGPVGSTESSIDIYSSPSSNIYYVDSNPSETRPEGPTGAPFVLPYSATNSWGKASLALHTDDEKTALSTRTSQSDKDTLITQIIKAASTSDCESFISLAEKLQATHNLKLNDCVDEPYKQNVLHVLMMNIAAKQQEYKSIADNDKKALIKHMELMRKPYTMLEYAIEDGVDLTARNARGFCPLWACIDWLPIWPSKHEKNKAAQVAEQVLVDAIKLFAAQDVYLNRKNKQSLLYKGYDSVIKHLEKDGYKFELTEKDERISRTRSIIKGADPTANIILNVDDLPYLLTPSSTISLKASYLQALLSQIGIQASEDKKKG
jgi:hypothetical protein